MKPLDAKSVRDEILNLLRAYPELEQDEVLRADMIEGDTNTHEFLSALVRKIGSTQAIVVGTIAYAKELQERITRMERREYALRSLIKSVMDTANLRKAELPEATLSIRNGVPKVQIINEHEIPHDFQRIKLEPDKIKIKAALIAKGYVPGAVLSNPEPTLAIIVK